MIKSRCSSICGTRREPACGHHHNSAPSIHSHEKSTLSSVFRNDLTTRSNVTESYTYTCMDTHAQVQYAYTGMSRHTEKLHSCLECIIIILIDG